MNLIRMTIAWLLLLAAFVTAQNTTEWETVNRMAVPVANGYAVWFNDAIYVFGGISDSTDAPIDLVQKYNINTNEWSIAGRLKSPRAHFVADVRNDVVILIGGVSGETEKSVSTIERWSPYTSIKEDSLDYSVMNRVGAVGGIYNNVFYLFGGDGPQDSVVPFATEYNLALDTINRSWEYNELHPYQSSLVKNQQNFYLFGGVMNGSIRSEIFQYDAFHKQMYFTAARLDHARASSAAVLDMRSNAYIIGGYGESGKSLATVEKVNFGTSPAEVSEFYPLYHAAHGLMAVYVPNYWGEYSAIFAIGGWQESGQANPYVERIYIKDSTSSVDHEELPQKHTVLHNYPNPFNAQTTLTVDLMQQTRVELSIYAADGQFVTKLENNILPAGSYRYIWTVDAKVSSGVYFCQLVTDSGVHTKKLLLVK